uniref:Uncharacterized protein n=1 Tax=Anguilla anguilla TaxID=7936 RepID=A0A0E9WSM8_ANGAN
MVFVFSFVSSNARAYWVNSLGLLYHKCFKRLPDKSRTHWSKLVRWGLSRLCALAHSLILVMFRATQTAHCLFDVSVCTGEGEGFLR